MGVRMDLELTIDELVLHGFATGDRYQVGEALRHELARLLTEQGVPSALVRSGTLASLDAGTFAVEPGTRASTIGVQVAQSVYRGLDS